ncbi:hypothetical protein CRV08_12720 [Halarcobacter ebronensis]|uniref:YobI-like P-loop NTPase domain-containing protein n=1 Tax=Halarcobacter ebronensis TaxID=1462615 RepID=A0A4Q0Y8C0_9BACT|nr:hypothetical protein [Halarcobacter ebronensis]RXJ66476.1 hypothetical protein CRV08_12720 [Halarcobacter ebronensis]
MDKDTYECKKILENLSPINNAVNNEIYDCSLKQGIDNKDIKNIALAGAYGSGKSSILRTFEEKHKNEYKFLNISLADFSNSEKNSENIDIERSILQKMFYTVKSEDIPFSRFRRIKDISLGDLKKYSLYIFIFLFSFFIAYENKDLPEYLSYLKFNVSYIVFFIICLIGLFFIIPNIVTLIKDIDLKKINLKSGELDLGYKDSSSILNKNLDEIIYFFKVTKYNIVIFEDLDRYESKIDIFIKLREINLILNNSNEIKYDIKFIYAIKDDTFIDEERTKFFDLIIPVIPIVDYSNSSEQLKVMIKRYKEYQGVKRDILKSSFINEICLYINNMRLLKNIFNEFIIYHNKLEMETIKSPNNNEKLFSIIVYKNLYPDDFSKLSNNNGIAYSIISKKDIIIDNKIRLMQEEINKYKKEIDTIESEQIKSIDELRSIYIFNTLKRINPINNSEIIIDSTRFNISILINEENFEKLRNSKKIRINGYEVIEFVDVEKDISSLGYEDREKLIKNKSKNHLEQIKKEIEVLELEKVKIRTKNLKELIENIDDIFDKETKKNGLLVYLVINGYFDENYSYYISHFYEESISKSDREFILSIREKREKEYSYKLERVGEVVKQLNISEFNKKEILNFDLLEHLYEINRKSEINQIIKQINVDRNLDFINGFIESNYKYIEKFIKSLVEQCTWLWDEIYNSKLSEDTKEKYLQLIFRYMNIKNFEKQNIDLISEYISEIDNFSKFSKDIDIEKIKEILSIIKPSFKTISQIRENKEILQYVYENNFYSLSHEIIEEILIEFNENEFKKEDLLVKNLSIIKKSTCKSLIEYVNSNIEQYIENVLLKLENLEEDENVLEELFNNNIISDNIKIALIDKSITKISDINKIEVDKLWFEFFKKNKIKADWKNILCYYEKFKILDEFLFEFMNIIDNVETLSKTRLNTKSEFIKNSEFKIDLVESLLKEILLENDFSIESYALLIKANGYWYKSLDITKLDEEKITLLVKEGKFQLTIENFNLLKEYTNNQHIKLIEKNIKDFLEKYEEYSIDEKDLTLMLESNFIDKKNKLLIIDKMDNLLVIDENIAKAIYDNMDRKKEYQFSFLENIFSYLNNCEMKVVLLKEQNQNLNDDDFISLLRLIGDEYEIISNQNGKRPKIKSTYYNRDLITILKERGFITKEKEEKNKMIRVFVKDVK